MLENSGIQKDTLTSYVVQYKPTSVLYFVGTTNHGGTRKPDNPLKRIWNMIPQDPDNPLKGIRDLVQN